MYCFSLKLKRDWNISDEGGIIKYRLKNMLQEGMAIADQMPV